MIQHSSTGEQLDELLVDIMGAPQVGRNQPANGSTASSTASGIVAAYREDPEVVYPAAPHKSGPNMVYPDEPQVIGPNHSMAKAAHGLHFTDVGFSVVDKGLPCMGGSGGVKEILRSVTGQVFRGDYPCSPLDCSW